MRTHDVTGGNGTTLRVDEAGDPDDDPILLIHGLSQSRLAWREQFDSHLVDEFRLVAMDLRGHGESDKPRDAYDDLEVWAADVRAVIDSLGLDGVVLVGWSYGAAVIADYLATHGSDGVAGLNLVGPAVNVEGVTIDENTLGEEMQELAPTMTSTDAEECIDTLESFVRLLVYDDPPVEDLYTTLGYNAVVPPYVRDGLLGVDHEPLPTDPGIPVLVTHGEEDAIVRAIAGRTYAEGIEGAEGSFYPDVGHSPFREAPERFDAELSAFVSEL
jgi:pimeloyl-ACP methyl ester carboxylesterase